MQLNDQMEAMSFAYISAVGAGAGFDVRYPRRDRGSIDGSVHSEDPPFAEFQFQAKATSADLIAGREIRFPLPVKNQRDLAVRSTVPRVLIVMLLPTDTGEWLEQTTDELCVRKCAYWTTLEGQDPSPNRHTVTVSVPLANVFDVSAAQRLIAEAEGRQMQ